MSISKVAGSPVKSNLFSHCLSESQSLFDLYSINIFKQTVTLVIEIVYIND
jgi:hypothetical protein